MSRYVFKMPDLGEGTVSAEVVEWKVKVGDTVKEDQIIAEVMTDKAAVEIPAPVSGRVLSITGQPGDMVAVGAELIAFETSGAAAAEPAAVAKPASAPALAAAPAARAGRSHARDGLAGDTAQGACRGRRSLDREWHGPRRADFGAGPRVRDRGEGQRRGEACGPRDEERRRGDQDHRRAPRDRRTHERRETQHPALRLRRGSGRHGARIAPAIPQFAPAERRASLTYLPFLVAALVRVLESFPQCNAVHDAERNLILRHSAVHVGIATQTPDGLKVPVVKHAEARSLHDLAAEIRRVSEAARSNKATREELMGSTITVTSLGRLGGIASTPVINAPEVAIIGVNKAVERPVVLDGAIAIRRIMNLSSSFDHRFVDGFDAAAMIQALKERLEHPATIFIQD